MIGIVSFASGTSAWKRAGRRIEKQLQSIESGKLVSKVYFNLQDLYMERADFEFTQANSKGLGYWVWKPYTVLRFLHDHPETKSIIYLDAGCDITEQALENHILKLYQGLNGKQGLFFNMPDIPEWKFTKRNLANEISPTEQMMLEPQITATIFFLTREFAIELCEQWLRTMRLNNYNLLNDEVSDEIEGFVAHRHDQSIVSLLIKKLYSNQVTIQSLSEFEKDNAWVQISRNRSSLPVADERTIATLIKLCEKAKDRTERLYLEAIRRRREVRGL